MAVKIRLKRLGRRNRPYYRICVFEASRPRDGKEIEKLGTYDPLVEDDAKAITLDKERLQYWLDNGAQMSDTVKSLAKKAPERKKLDS